MENKIRYIGGWLLAIILIACGFVRRAKKRALKGEFILSIYFHKPSRNEFESCIKWLIKNKFTFLSIADIQNITEQGLPFPEGAALLTVDDGWASNEENIIEVANKYKVPVAIFIATGPVEEGAYWWSYLYTAKKNKIKCPNVPDLKRVSNKERLLEVDKLRRQISLTREALTIEQVKRAANSKYITIGGHTHTHPILPNCIDEQVICELDLSRNKLESWVNDEVSYFAYPNGDYGAREINALKMLNYKYAFCSEPLPLTPDKLKESYLLPRFGFLEGASSAENICRIVGVWQPLMLKFKKLLWKRQNNAKTNPTVIRELTLG